MSETFADLRRMSDEELIERHDRRAANTEVGTQHYLQELARRDAVGQGDRIEALTVTVARLTWVITILTLANVVATVFTVLR